MSTSTSIADLPDDPATLKGFIASMLEQLEQLARDNDRLKHQLELLRQRVFGRSSEKVDPAQLLLFMDMILDQTKNGAEGAQPAPEPGDGDDDKSGSEASKRKSSHGRGQLPAHLPRQRREVPPRPEDLVCDCCNKERKRFGEDVSLRLDYVPGSFLVIEEVRGKFACSDCAKSVSIPPVPARPIPKGIAEPGLLAQVLVSKYADHLPLERQSTIYARHGLNLSPSTLMDWVARSVEALLPLYDELCRDVLSARILNTDDTPILVLHPNGPGTHKGRLWTYVSRLDRFGTVYDFSPTWEGIHPQRFLASFTGILQSDAYGGYEKLFETGLVTSAGCNAHSRRGYHKARSSDPARAHVGLAFYRRLYAIERDCRELSKEEREAVRRSRATPILEQLEAWLHENQPQVLPKSPIGAAITYTLNNWAALVRYIEDGDLDIDNGAAERALRYIAVGRNNWLFAGSDEGGRRAAVVYSFIQSCKQIGVEPFAYLRDVLTRLPEHPRGRLIELIPRAWKSARDAEADDHET